MAQSQHRQEQERLQEQLVRVRSRSNNDDNEDGNDNDNEDDNDNDDVSSVASTDVNINSVEKMMATEMERLSLKDRNAIYEEIHGVSTMAIEETPELLDESLHRFQEELDKIDGDIKFAYDYITHQEDDLPSKRLAFDRSFRLRFLRCVFFNPAKAAARMVRYFGVLDALYGREALTKFDGTMDFFVGDKSDQIAFRNGYLQLLPFRDRSGRKILVLVLDALEIEDTTRVRSKQQTNRTNQSQSQNQNTQTNHNNNCSSLFQEGASFILLTVVATIGFLVALLFWYLKKSRTRTQSNASLFFHSSFSCFSSRYFCTWPLLREKTKKRNGTESSCCSGPEARNCGCPPRGTGAWSPGPLPACR